MCTPPLPHPLPMIAAPGQPAWAGARVRTHGPRCRPRSPFLAALGGYSPARRACAAGGPSSPGTWGPQAAPVTFVHCRRASRDVCKLQTDPRGSAAVPAMLGAGGFPPRVSSSPSCGGFLPLPPSSLSPGAPLQGDLGGPGRAWAAARAATMQPRRGSGRWGGIGEPGDVFAVSGALAGLGGRARVGARGWVGPERPALPAGGRRGLPHVGGRSLACRPRPGAVY